ncbi:MAG: hypothetical protein ACYDBB_06155 [Armatimonadota bacterium]
MRAWVSLLGLLALLSTGLLLSGCGGGGGTEPPDTNLGTVNNNSVTKFVTFTPAAGKSFSDVFANFTSTDVPAKTSIPYIHMTWNGTGGYYQLDYSDTTTTSFGTSGAHGNYNMQIYVTTLPPDSTDAAVLTTPIAVSLNIGPGGEVTPPPPPPW